MRQQLTIHNMPARHSLAIIIPWLLMSPASTMGMQHLVKFKQFFSSTPKPQTPQDQLLMQEIRDAFNNTGLQPPLQATICSYADADNPDPITIIDLMKPPLFQQCAYYPPYDPYVTREEVVDQRVSSIVNIHYDKSGNLSLLGTNKELIVISAAGEFIRKEGSKLNDNQLCESKAGDAYVLQSLKSNSASNRLYKATIIDKRTNKKEAKLRSTIYEIWYAGWNDRGNQPRTKIEIRQQPFAKILGIKGPAKKRNNLSQMGPII